MGCGCGKKGPAKRVPALRVNLNRPKVSPPVAPAQLRALGMQRSTQFVESRQMDANRRRIEKLRRDAIKERLNK
jgi:hypothetical protein